MKQDVNGKGHLNGECSPQLYPNDVNRRASQPTILRRCLAAVEFDPSTNGCLLMQGDVANYTTTFELSALTSVPI